MRKLLRDKRVYVTLELIGLAILLAALGWALRDVWAEAVPLLRHADLGDVAIATAIVAVYYLVFVLGWLRILAAYGIRIPYRYALQAEMLSMLAKYIPGGIWTPTARVVALRRFGVKDTPRRARVDPARGGALGARRRGVFVVGLAIVGGADVTCSLSLAFGVLVAICSTRGSSRPWHAGAAAVRRRAAVRRCRTRTMLRLLGFYALTWPLGGARSSSSSARSAATRPLGHRVPRRRGAVGAIVAVLAIFAPSGLGVREASMYGLLLAVTPRRSRSARRC